MTDTSVTLRTWTSFTNDNSPLPLGRFVQAFSSDSNNNLWICVWKRYSDQDFGGLVKIKDTTWTVYTHQNTGIPIGGIWSIAIDDQDDLWLGSTWNGLIHYNGANWEQFNKSNSDIPDNEIQSIALDGSGNFWIGTMGGYLAMFDGTNWAIYDSTNSILTNSAIFCVLADHDGKIWVGTYEDGLFCFNYPAYLDSLSDEL